ncbi:MAG: ABC transporter permease, partial [Terriglobia bacterium]
AVISYGYWERGFGRSRSVIGKAVSIDRVPFTIVGVAPPEFFGVEPGTRLEIWVPITTAHAILPDWGDPGQSLFAERNNWWVLIMGRLKPGVTGQQARAAMSVLFTQSMTTGLNPTPKSQLLPQLETSSASKGLNELRKEFSKPLWILMALVGLVLLIACANVANLLLAKSAARQKEIAVRLAIGASRLRLIRQLLTESVLLAAMGGACGILLAFWGTHILLALIASGRESLFLDVHPDGMILAFTAAVSLVTGILFGLAPALRATHVDITPALKENAGSAPANRGAKSKLGRALVVAQVAASLLLLIGAGLFVRTLENLENQNLGFNRHNLLLFGIGPGRTGYEGERLANLYKELLLRIQALPGVESASLSERGLIGAGETIDGITIEGYTPKSASDNQVKAWVNAVGPQFFKTTGIKLLLGRGVGAIDTENSPKIAVVNEALARQVFGNGSPIGRRFAFGKPKSAADEFTIAGLVQNAKYGELRNADPPTVYVPYLQALSQAGAVYFEVRTHGNPLAMVPSLRQVVNNVDKNLPLFDIHTETEKIGESLMQERLFAQLSSFFGGLALLLACVGLYGVLSYSVARRTNEIGIRMALGAQRGDILWMVLRETLLLIGIGVAIGVPCALAASKLVSRMLFGLKSTDPVTIGIATAVMLAVAVLAGYLPARRASRVDPLVALRYE